LPELEREDVVELFLVDGDRLEEREDDRELEPWEPF